MKIMRNFLVLSFVFLSFLAFNVQAQTPQTPLEKKIFKEIRKLPYYGVFDHIAFKVEGSTVYLYGKVYNGTNKSGAKNAIKNLDGVTEVVNNIEILPPSPFDNTIRRNILQSFSRNGGSLYRYLLEPDPSIRIIVENGHITLEGYVSNRGDSNLANILANGVPSVFSVTNNLVIAKSPR